MIGDADRFLGETLLIVSQGQRSQSAGGRQGALVDELDERSVGDFRLNARCVRLARRIVGRAGSQNQRHQVRLYQPTESHLIESSDPYSCSYSSLNPMSWRSCSA